MLGLPIHSLLGYQHLHPRVLCQSLWACLAHHQLRVTVHTSVVYPRYWYCTPVASHRGSVRAAVPLSRDHTPLPRRLLCCAWRRVLDIMFS